MANESGRQSPLNNLEAELSTAEHSDEARFGDAIGAYLGELHEATGTIEELLEELMDPERPRPEKTELLRKYGESVFLTGMQAEQEIIAAQQQGQMPEDTNLQVIARFRQENPEE